MCIRDRDTSSHDLERQDDVIGVTTDTVNDATETPTHIPIDVSVVVKEPSINDMVEDTGNASLVKKSVGIEIDNSPITKKKLRKPGIEPGAQRWQRWILPLNHLRSIVVRCSR